MTGPSALNFGSLDCRARLRPPQRRRLWLHSSTSCLVCALRPPLTEAQAQAGQQRVACHVAIGAVPNLNFTGKLKARGSKVLPVVSQPPAHADTHGRSGVLAFGWLERNLKTPARLSRVQLTVRIS